MNLLQRWQACRFISIKTKMIAVFLAVIVVPIVTMSVNSYYSSQKLLVKKYTDLLLEISRQSNVRIEEYLKDVQNISLLAGYGVNGSQSTEGAFPIQNFLKDDSPANEREAYTLLLNSIMMKDRSYSIYLYNLQGGKHLYVSSGKKINFDYNPSQEQWFRDILQSEDAVSVVGTRRDSQIRDENNWVISSVRKIYDMRDGKLLGVMVFSFDIDVIDKICGRILENRRSAFTIVDKDNTILYNSDYQTIGKNFFSVYPANWQRMDRESGGFIARNGNDSNIVTYMSFEKLPWKAILYLSLDEVSIERALLRQNLVFIALILFLFTFASFYFLSNRITKPIRKLMRHISLVEKGQFDHLPAIRSNDEIGMLAKRFQTMSQELKQLVQRITIEQKQKADAELSALQAQINPHFMYNTLSSVKWMASIQKSEKIVQMIESLIYMLRYSTSKIGDLVTIGDEVEHIRHYMTIQKVRYYNKINIEYDIDESLLEYRILKLTLQPIVENAIFHGLANCEEEGWVRLQIRRCDDDIVIAIADNGVGMDRETIAAVQQQMQRMNEKRKHIGISNVNNRIKMHFGGKYGIHFESELGRGTVFYLLLPAVREEAAGG